MQQNILTHEFTEHIPDDLEEGKLYVSIPYATVVHKCCCGCGSEVVTPLSPTDWKLTFDGKSISLDPSIGNWNFSCRSHYWIKRNKVRWAYEWSDAYSDGIRPLIPSEGGQRFRRKAATHSDGIRPPFRLNPATDSDAKRPLIPTESGQGGVGDAG